MTVDMSAPSLPVAYIDIDDYAVNEMHGYLNRMNVGTIRDSVTPIGEDRQVSFIIDKYDTGISSLEIEVRSADGTRLIENTALLQYSDYKETLKASVNLKDLIEAGKEYNLVLILHLSDGRTAYYYTRVIQNEKAGAGEKIKFVNDFCLKTFSKENVKELAAFMESNSEGDNTSFGHVDIHSSMNQLTWGNLEPKLVGRPSTTIEEIGASMASLELKYQVSTKEGRNVHYYNVTEYYRIRVTSQRTYLLSFNRTMNEVFAMDKNSFTNDKIALGIQNDEVQMMESLDGEILAFENDGRLYCYNATENKLVRLFAFYDLATDDYRSRYRGSEIKILDVEENGNISFLVYGYMNRGTHEGEVGAELCYYNGVLNTIEELVYIPYTNSEEVLKCDIDKLCHLNITGDLIIFIDGVVYRIIPSERDYSVLASNINEATFFVSESGKSMVWQERDDKDQNNIASNLTVMNLATGNSNTIEKNSREYVKPIGFMNEDLIYGISSESDLIYNALGDITFPMNRVIIQAEDGTILKEYDNENVYVTSGSVQGNQITLERVKKNPETGEMSIISDDHITNNSEVEPGKNEIAIAVTDTYEKITQIQLKKVVDPKVMKLLTPKEVLYEGGRAIKLKNPENKNRFLVYGDGEVVGIYDKPAQAVAMAYSIRGTVADLYGNEIYRRGETVARNQIMSITEDQVTIDKPSLAVCLDTMLKLQGIARNTEYALEKGDNAYDILSANLTDAYVLNLTGCTMDMMLYYVNLDVPVLGVLNDGSAVLIIGFNEQNTVLFDPKKGEIYKKGMNDSREMFEENGNRFMTYAVKREN